jgi:hypothetical protein
MDARDLFERVVFGKRPPGDVTKPAQKRPISQPEVVLSS